jgi:hypothetical protein
VRSSWGILSLDAVVVIERLHGSAYRDWLKWKGIRKMSRGGQLHGDVEDLADEGRIDLATAAPNWPQSGIERKRCTTWREVV